MIGDTLSDVAITDGGFNVASPIKSYDVGPMTRQLVEAYITTSTKQSFYPETISLDDSTNIDVRAYQRTAASRHHVSDASFRSHLVVGEGSSVLYVLITSLCVNHTNRYTPLASVTACAAVLYQYSRLSNPSNFASHANISSSTSRFLYDPPKWMTWLRCVPSFGSNPGAENIPLERKGYSSFSGSSSSSSRFRR